MAKEVQAQLILKHDTAAAWATSTYIPADGEPVVYDGRLKIGNGKDLVKDLPFSGTPVQLVVWEAAD